MARGVLENLFNADKIDALFARTAEVQYTRELLFSSVVDLMGQVVLGVQPSVHAAYQGQAAQLGISDQAVYDKLRQVELRVSAELVRDAARQAAPVIWGAVAQCLQAMCTRGEMIPSRIFARYPGTSWGQLRLQRPNHWGRLPRRIPD